MSTDSKPTPGPWQVCMVPANEHWFAGITIGSADPSDGRRICDVFTAGAAGDEVSQMHVANARLIAEAGTVAHETGLTPRQLVEQRAELLHALRNCVEHGGQRWALAQAKVVIAKATGGQP